MYEEYLKHFDLSITDDMRNFVKETLKNSEYLFVRNENKYDPLSNEKVKVQCCYCSHCGKEYKTGYHLKHNEVIVCPECGAEIAVKDIRYGKKCLRNDFCFYWFDKSIVNPKVVTCKGYYFSKEYYKDYKNPHYEYSIQALYIFDTETNKSIMLKHNYWEDKYEERASVFDFNINWLGNKWCYLAEESLDSAVKDTIFQYSNYKSKCGHTSIVRYLDAFNKYPWIEQLEKMGFHSLVKTLENGWSTDYAINYRGKDIFKNLKLNRAEVKQLTDEQKRNLDSFELRIYQLNRNNGFKKSFQEAHEVSKLLNYSYLDGLIRLVKMVGTNKLLKYCKRQFKYFNKNNSYYDKSSVIGKWDDYLKNCEELQWDIKDKSILYPKDLAKAHNHTTKLIRVQKNKDIDSKIAKRVEGLKEKYFFKDNTFFIRPAQNSEDLINEGGTLNHCVAVHYMKPYANKETDILMIRRIDNPTQPLVTVEVKNGEVRQAYGKNDTRPKKDVLEFIEKFKTEILENLKNNKKKNKKGKAA